MTHTIKMLAPDGKHYTEIPIPNNGPIPLGVNGGYLQFDPDWEAWVITDGTDQNYYLLDWDELAPLAAVLYYLAGHYVTA